MRTRLFAHTLGNAYLLSAAALAIVGFVLGGFIAEREDSRSLMAEGVFREALKAHAQGESGDGYGKELFEKACELGNATACGEIAYHEENNKSKARELFLVECARGRAWACSSVASLYFLENFPEKNFREAKRFSELACSGGEPLGCYFLGTLLAREDDRKLKMLSHVKFRKSCALGSGLGCYAFGVSLLEGTGGVVDVEMGRRAFLDACELDDADACHAAGLLTGRRNKLDDRYTKAALLHSKGCDLGSFRACGSLAFFMASGLGVAKDVDEAKRLNERACRGGDSKACGIRSGDAEKNLASVFGSLAR
jgi:hypothetical protein